MRIDIVTLFPGMITPVLAETTAALSTPSAAAAAAMIIATASAPTGPVIAFALPLFTTIARTPSAGNRASASTTGAAFARLMVNAPAHVAGVSDTNSARSGRIGLMPHATPENRNPMGSFIRASPSA